MLIDLLGGFGYCLCNHEFCLQQYRATGIMQLLMSIYFYFQKKFKKYTFKTQMKFRSLQEIIIKATKNLISSNKKKFKKKMFNEWEIA